MLKMLKRKIRFRMKGKPYGFTLIEMLTVCAIIGILATMAIASMRGGKQVALEAMAIGAMKHIAEAEYNYFSRHNTFTSWQGLLIEGDLIDPGYHKVDNLSDPYDTPIAMLYSIQVFGYSSTFSVVAFPVDIDTWSLRTFAVDTDGSILNNMDNPEYAGFY